VANISLDYRPVANPDNSSNNAVGTAVTLNVLANDNGGDTDFDYGSLRILGTNAAGDPLVVTGQGTWTVNVTNGRITFTPEPGFTADPSPIRYNVRDTDGNLSNYAAVTIDYIDACVGFPLTLIIDDLSTSGYDIIVVDNAAAGTATSFGNSTHADVNLTTLGNLAFIGSTAKFSYICYSSQQTVPVQPVSA
jgi:CshA-type fibril repeat protein